MSSSVRGLRHKVAFLILQCRFSSDRWDCAFYHFHLSSPPPAARDVDDLVFQVFMLCKLRIMPIRFAHWSSISGHTRGLCWVQSSALWEPERHWYLWFEPARIIEISYSYPPHPNRPPRIVERGHVLFAWTVSSHHRHR